MNMYGTVSSSAGVMSPNFESTVHTLMPLGISVFLLVESVRFLLAVLMLPSGSMEL